MSTHKNFDLNTHTFNGHTLRTVVIDGILWFSVRDVFAALDRENNPVKNMKAALDTSAEYRVLSRRDFREDEVHLLFPRAAGRGGSSFLALVAESGLYKYVLRAQRTNPAAREFQDWVTKEVLPRIRRDGAYIMGEEKVKLTFSPSPDRRPHEKCARSRWEICTP